MSTTQGFWCRLAGVGRSRDSSQNRLRATSGAGAPGRSLHRSAVMRDIISCVIEGSKATRLNLIGIWTRRNSGCWALLPCRLHIGSTTRSGVVSHDDGVWR